LAQCALEGLRTVIVSQLSVGLVVTLIGLTMQALGLGTSFFRFLYWEQNKIDVLPGLSLRHSPINLLVILVIFMAGFIRRYDRVLKVQ
jgi:hypothetical protein